MVCLVDWVVRIDIEKGELFYFLRSSPPGRGRGGLMKRPVMKYISRAPPAGRSGAGLYTHTAAGLRRRPVSVSIPGAGFQ